ncbi:hypothetical protein ABLE91_09465 [Aquabacter sp. CN5-332]|uniref:hypothetical protein n=1 Tax=Aquabacter sp. CN5-332 TaxID=3156608 RepID=UPI0032B5DBFA
MFRPVRLALALVLASGLAGCETFDKINPFSEKETPLSGERHQVFPEGVPGVSYTAPVAQPSNSNIAVSAPTATNAGTPSPGASTRPGN